MWHRDIQAEVLELSALVEGGKGTPGDIRNSFTCKTVGILRALARSCLRESSHSTWPSAQHVVSTQLL